MKRVSDIPRVYWLAAAILTVGILAVFYFGGCSFGQRLNRSVQAFKMNNPDANTIPVDKDGDGTIDFLGADVNCDGKVDVDSAGKPIAVPGSASAYGEAEATDASISELIVLAGGVIGIPGVGLVGSWWGRRKPLKHLTTLVQKFEAARTDDSVEGAVTFSKEVLNTIRDEQPELYALVRAIRNSTETK